MATQTEVAVTRTPKPTPPPAPTPVGQNPAVPPSKGGKPIPASIKEANDPYAGRKTLNAEHPVVPGSGKTETLKVAFRGQEKAGNRTFSHPLTRASAYLSKSFFKPGFTIPRDFVITMTVEVPVGEDRVFATVGEGGPPGRTPAAPKAYTAESLAEAKQKLEKQKLAVARREASLARQQEQLDAAEEMLTS